MRRVLFFVPLTILAVSCSFTDSEPDSADINYDGLSYMCLEASLPEASKAHIQESGASLAQVMWDDDDVIAVYDGVAIRDFKIKEGTNTGKTAIFEGYASDTASELLLAYPRSAALSCDEDGFVLSIPAEQHAGGFVCDKSALIATARAAAGASFVMENANGLFAVPVSADVEKIVLCSKNNEQISGDSSSIVFVTNGKAETYYIAAAPNVYLGLRVFAITSGGDSYMVDTGNLLMLDAGQCLRLGSGPMPLSNKVTVIHDEDSMRAFMSLSSTTFKDDVYMVADVTMSAPAEGAPGFAGIFHGLGHILSSWISSSPLFGTNSGTVSDLTLAPDCVFTPDSDYFGAIAGINGGKLVNIVSYASIMREMGTHDTPLCYGGIAGYSTGEMSGCANYGKVSVAASGPVSQSTGVGGIAGYLAAPMTGCINDGEVCLKGQSFSGISAIGSISNALPSLGGLVAYAAPGFKLTGCENRGDLSFSFSAVDKTMTADIYTSSPMAYPSIGGLVGSTCGDATNCTNSGDINIEISSESKGTPLPYKMNTFVGGIAGADFYFSSTSGTVANADYINCYNSGNINFYSDASLGLSGVGGIVGYPGQEKATSKTTKKCTNVGNISFSGPIRVRAGGIHGGSGNVEDCTNSGVISLAAEGDSQCSLGGIAGLHTQTHWMKDCVSTGDIRSLAGARAGGLIGNMGNVSNNTGTGCYVDCTVQNYDPAGLSTGMLVGYFNGSAAITLGAVMSPITIQGTVNLDGYTNVPITATNYKQYLAGSINGDNKIYYTQFAPAAEGYVKYSDGNPAKGVTVSDGFNVTYTDDNGYYSISTGSDTRYIYISYPSDAVISKNSDGCPDFFKKYSGPGTYDFTFDRQAVESDFRLIAMADPQAHYAKNSGYNKIDITRFGEETVPAVNEEIASSSVPCYGVTLGDIVNTVRASDSTPGMTQMREKFALMNMPVFQTMGNHDHTFWYGSGNPLKTDSGSSTLYLAAQRKFEDCFGPVNLSFNRGKVHVVCMRNINYDSTTEPLVYHGGFTDSQYKWLQADLANVPSDYMVILCVHIPVSSSSGGENLSNVLKLISSHPNSMVWSGHTHYGRAVYNVLGTGLFEQVHPAVCGMWWTSKLNGDGVPNCYTVYSISGNEVVSTVLRGVNENMNARDYQMRIYRGNLVCGGYYGYFKWPFEANTLLINVFNGNSRWTVKVYENGEYSGNASLINQYSQTFSSISPGQTYTVDERSSQDWWMLGYYKGNQGRARNSTDNYTANYHMFKFEAKSASSAITVEATDPWGNTYTCSEVWASGFTYPSYIAKP